MLFRSPSPSWNRVFSLSPSLNNESIPPNSGGTFRSVRNHLNLLSFRDVHDVEKSVNINLPIQKLFYIHRSVKQWNIRLYAVIMVIVITNPNNWNWFSSRVQIVFVVVVVVGDVIQVSC